MAHLARYTASLSAITLATTAVAMTMSSLGFEPTLDLADSAQPSGLGGAFVSGMSVAVRIGAAITFVAMLIALLPLELRRSLRQPR